jgi:hypothetical protein
MKKTSLFRILGLAKKFAKDNINWHFHILSPGCVFNRNKKFSLILEDGEKDVQYIHLSLRRPSKTGQKLLKLQEKRGSKSKGEVAKVFLSARVVKMTERAKELNNKGFSWHYHLLLPNCVFNKDSRYWSLVFEDPLNGEIIEEKFTKEPKKALGVIEPLFYSQMK